MATPASDHVEQLRLEKALLLKAEADIEEGWQRLRNQQDLLLELQASGHDTGQAEHLMQLMKTTLVQWERHRDLIEERISYLQNKVDAPLKNA